MADEDPEVDLALNVGNGSGLSEIGDSYEIIKSSSSDQYTPLPQPEQHTFVDKEKGGFMQKLMCTGQSLGFNEAEENDDIFGE